MKKISILLRNTRHQFDDKIPVERNNALSDSPFRLHYANWRRIQRRASTRRAAAIVSLHSIMQVIVSNKGNMPAGDTATCMPSRSAILYRAVRNLKGLRNANSVSLVFCSRDWYRFYRYQSRALDVPANPHRVPHSGRIFTATTESRCREIIESQSCIRLLPAPLSLAAHTRRAVSGFVETSFLRQWLTTMRVATKTLQGPA